MRIIVGLGNPGDKYQNTRHNAGFLVLGELADRYGCSFSYESKFKSEIAKCTINCEQVMLLKPQTFMNLSGEALALVMNYFKCDISDIIVVFDDISLDLGNLRFRPNGSDGGHNGIKSIVNNLGGNKSFVRLKVGIGPQPPFMPSERFVLGEFASAEKDLLQNTVKVSANAIECFLKSGISEAQNKFNGMINL